MNVAEFTISGLRAAYASGDLTPTEALTALAKEIDHRDSALGGYLSHDLERALAEAENVDLSLPLGGVPIAIKDLVNVKGHPCSCASKFLHGSYTAPYDATVIRKLREAGAIPFGRTNMDEFAMGSSNETSALGPCRNPHDPERIPGGSSGGSAVVVAANTAIAALGSDTGGSIRQPAAHCGVVGLKPSYGRVSRYGIAAMASSLDQCGPMTKTVEDAAALLEVLAGYCEYDATSSHAPVPRYTEELGKGIQGMRIGLPGEYFAEGLDPLIRERVEQAIEVLVGLGAETVPITLPHAGYAAATYYVLSSAEASSNLARIDGVRYGRRSEASDDLANVYLKSRSEGFGDEVKRRLISGTYFLSAGAYDTYYVQAQKVRTLIRRDFEEAFAQVDLIVSPTTPNPPFRLGEQSDDLFAAAAADLYTVSANLAGICGISVPCGTIPVDGKELPVGLQLLAKPFAEAELLRAAHAYEMTRR